MKRLIITIIIFTAWFNALCSNPDSISAQPKIAYWTVEAGVNSSRVIPTNSFLKTVSGNDAVIAPDIRASFKFDASTRYGRLFPGVRQGLAVGLNNFLPNSTLGTPALIYLFQSIRIAGSNRLWLEGEWNFGISAGWSKYNPASDIVNNAIGSRINAMLGVGVSGVYALSDRWRLKATLNGIHYSNGNTHLPNAGVNTVGLMIGAQYIFDPVKPLEPLLATEQFKRGFSYDVTAYGATRRRIAENGPDDYTMLKGSFGVAGINVAAMYDLNRYFRFGLSADMQYDESANLAKHRVENSYGDDIKFYRQPFADCFAAGLSIRAELTLPIFSINAGIGRNIIANGPDTRIFYQTLALKAYVWQGAFLQV
ncbi:MAG: acyloxyacyl hydrolase, partial [Muribaculaceae bacterium]|nr:acyloxyacyl hydrolase [Muribaculaceae bacterium]